MRYRIGLHPYSISEFGPVHTVDTNVPVGDGRYRIHAIFSDGHPHNVNNSLHYLRYENSGLSRGGRAWPHDIALDTNGRPRVVYTRRVGGEDTFWYAYHNGKRWISRKIVDAGWTSRPLTADPSGFSMRPVTPRRMRSGNQVLYVWGDRRTTSFTKYVTRIHVLDF